jgi:hypothetical protein
VRYISKELALKNQNSTIGLKPQASLWKYDSFEFNSSHLLAFLSKFLMVKTKNRSVRAGKVFSIQDFNGKSRVLFVDANSGRLVAKITIAATDFAKQNISQNNVSIVAFNHDALSWI